MDQAVTIPKELAREGDMIVISRREYEKFLQYKNAAQGEEDEGDLWRSAAKRHLFDSYADADAIYDDLSVS